MPTTHGMRLLNLGAVLTAVLSLGAIIGTAACDPPPLPPPPPPPTTAAMRYVPCGNLNLEPFQCEIRANAWAGTTWATAGARTLEPATFIGMVMTLEKRQPDGSWVVEFTDNKGLGGVTQVRDETSAIISCNPGSTYRWHLNVIFVSHQNTTYTATSGTVVT